MGKRIKEDESLTTPQAPGFLDRFGPWLIAKLVSLPSLSEQIKNKETEITIPTNYAQLKEGNVISGLLLFHAEKKNNVIMERVMGDQNIKQEHTLRIWIYVTAGGAIGYIESLEIQGQKKCSWQHSLWQMDKDDRLKVIKEDSHSVPGMTHAILRGILLERIGYAFERNVIRAIKDFSKN